MRKASLLLVLVLTVSFVAVDLAQAQGPAEGRAIARLRSFEEVPAISTPGGGRFNAEINEDGTEMEWELRYFNMQGTVTQAHIHFAQRGVNGGIVIFLCSNLGNAPAGVPACPANPGTVSGVIEASDVLPLPAQGIGAGRLDQVLRAIRAGVAYVNVHTNAFPGGEVRGQLLFEPAP